MCRGLTGADRAVSAVADGDIEDYLEGLRHGIFLSVEAASRCRGSVLAAVLNRNLRLYPLHVAAAGVGTAENSSRVGVFIGPFPVGLRVMMPDIRSQSFAPDIFDLIGSQRERIGIRTVRQLFAVGHSDITVLVYSVSLEAVVRTAPAEY